MTGRLTSSLPALRGRYASFAALILVVAALAVLVGADGGDVEAQQLGPNDPAECGSSPLNGRTKAVADAVTSKLSRSDCSTVSSTDLTSSSLVTLEIRNNSNLTTLRAGDFDGMTETIYLYLTGNGLTSLPSGTFNGLDKLGLLDLKNNELAELPKDLFVGLGDELTHLHLDGNELHSLHETLFYDISKQSVQNFEYLNLSNNKLTALPAGIFDRMVQLKVLYLDGNSNLGELPHGVFDAMPTNASPVNELDLRGTSVTCLPSSEHYSDLQRITISGPLSNPINPTNLPACPAPRLPTYPDGTIYAEAGTQSVGTNSVAVTVIGDVPRDTRIVLSETSRPTPPSSLTFTKIDPPDALDLTDTTIQLGDEQYRTVLTISPVFFWTGNAKICIYTLDLNEHLGPRIESYHILSHSALSSPKWSVLETTVVEDPVDGDIVAACTKDEILFPLFQSKTVAVAAKVIAASSLPPRTVFGNADFYSVGSKEVAVNTIGDLPRRMKVIFSEAAVAAMPTDGFTVTLRLDRTTSGPNPLKFNFGNPKTKIVDVAMSHSLGGNPVSVCMPVTDTLRTANSGISNDKLRIFRFDGQAWQELKTTVEEQDGVAIFACGETTSFSPFAIGYDNPVPTPTPIPMPKILRISPAVLTVTLSAGDRVWLGVDIYGVQDILDNSLGDDVSFEWTIEPRGGLFEEVHRDADADFEADEREVLLTVPSSPGRYVVRAELDKWACMYKDGDDPSEGCYAEMEVEVRRASAVPSPTATPFDPAVSLPQTIDLADGSQCSVFMPVGGGRHQNDDLGVSIVGGHGAVPSGEYVCVSVHDAGPASDFSKAGDRYRLLESVYEVSAHDSKGVKLDGYQLKLPLEVCLPLSQSVALDFKGLSIVSLRDKGPLSALSSTVVLGDSGIRICGALSTLSAQVAVGYLGATSDLLSPTPLPTPVVPDTGGGGGLSTGAWILLMALGFALGILSLLFAMPRERRVLE